MENIQKHINEIQRAYDPLVQSIQLAQSSYAKFAVDFQQRIKEAMQPYIDWNNIFRHQYQQSVQPYLETINKIREYVDTVSRITGPITFFDAVKEIQAEYQRIQAISIAAEQENAVDEFIDAIENQAKAAPKSALSLEFYISILFSIILFIASQNLSSKSEEKMNARFDRIEAYIATLSRQLQATATLDYYIVERSAMLRAASNNRSVIIAKMPVDLKVELLERNGKWVKVQFFSSKDSVLVDGWVLKKYLYRVQLKKTVSNQEAAYSR